MCSGRIARLIPPLAQQTAHNFGPEQLPANGATAYWHRGARDGVLALRRSAFCWAGTREGARRSHRGPAQRRSETDGSSRNSDLSRRQRRQGQWGGWCSLVAVPIQDHSRRHEALQSRQAPLRAPRHRITTPTPTAQKPDVPRPPRISKDKQQILLRRLRPLDDVINTIPPRQPPDKHRCRQLPQPGILLLAHAELQSF